MEFLIVVIVDLGNWEAYRGETPEGLAYARYRNAAGDDWYEQVAHHEDRPRGPAVLLDPRGQIVIAYDDVSQAEPRLGRVFVLQNYSGTPQELVGKQLDIVSGAITSPVPAGVTRAQALMALHNAGLLAQVQALFAGHEYLPIRLWFDNAARFERNHAYLQAIAIELELTEQQVDDLFIAASMLTQ